MYVRSSLIPAAGTFDRYQNTDEISLQSPCSGIGHVLTYTVQNGHRICGTPATIGSLTWYSVDPGNFVFDAQGRNPNRPGKPLTIRLRRHSPVFGDGKLGSADGETPAADAFYAMHEVFDYLETEAYVSGWTTRTVLKSRSGSIGEPLPPPLGTAVPET